MSPFARSRLAIARAELTRAVSWTDASSLADERTRYAIRYALLAACEAIGTIPPPDRALIELPHSSLRGLRNRLAHRCWDVDDRLLQELVTDLAPDLITRIDASVARP